MSLQRQCRSRPIEPRQSILGGAAEVASIGDIPIMPRSPRSSGRFHRRSSRDDDEFTSRKANPAALVAVIAVVVGAGLLIWVMSGGPMRRSLPPPSSTPDTTTAPSGSGSSLPSSNRPPRIELRVRIDPRQPHRMEYGAFSDDPDVSDDGKLVHAWDFGDGSPISASERGVHVFRRAGTFTVKVVVRDPAGASAQGEQTVTIPKPDHAVRSRARQNEISGLRVRRIDLPGGATFKALNDLWAAGEVVQASHITNEIRHRMEWYALSFTGAVIIPREGIWTFSVTSDDGSRLILDGQKLINMDQHQSPTTAYVAVQADAGLVPFQLDYYQGDSDQVLRVQWAGPGQDW